jgi:hypothetical protein
MDTLLVIILGWIVLSIPVSLLIGRFLAGNRRTADVSSAADDQQETPAINVVQRGEPQLETAFSEMLQASEN